MESEVPKFRKKWDGDKFSLGKSRYDIVRVYSQTCAEIPGGYHLSGASARWDKFFRKSESSASGTWWITIRRLVILSGGRKRNIGTFIVKRAQMIDKEAQMYSSERCAESPAFHSVSLHVRWVLRSRL